MTEDDRDALPRPVVVAGAPANAMSVAVEAAARPFLTHFVAPATRAVVAAGSGAVARDGNGPVQQIANLVAGGGALVRIVAPPRLVGAARRSVDASRWTTRPLPPGAGRFNSVPMPKTLADADALILVNRLPSSGEERSPVIGVWSHYVPLKLRLGALASGPREGLTAEIALAFRPSLIVLAGKVRGIALAVATDDQIAAELFGLASRAVMREQSDPETDIGPWENALVQRATELGLGVTLPTEIEVRSVWSSTSSTQRETFGALVAEVVTVLGIPGSIDHQEAIS